MIRRNVKSAVLHLFYNAVALIFPLLSTAILYFVPLGLFKTILPSFSTSSALLLVILPLELNTPFPTANAVSLDISLAIPTAPAPLLPLVKSCPCPAEKQNCLLTNCVCPKATLLFANDSDALPKAIHWFPLA